MKGKQSDNSLLNELKQLWNHLSRRRHTQLGLLLILLVVTSLSEIVSIGAIFPFLSALGNADSLLKASQLQHVFKLLQIRTAEELVQALAFGFIVATMVANGLRVLSLHSREQLAALIGLDVSTKVYYTILRQPYTFHVNHNSSDLIQTLTVDSDLLTNNILNQALTLLANAILIPALIVTLILIDTEVAVGAALFLGISYIIVYRTRQSLLKRNSKIIAQAGQQKIKAVQEGIGGIRDILLGHYYNFFGQVYLQSEVTLRQAMATNQIVAQSPTYFIEAMVLSAIALLALLRGQGDDFSQVVPILGSLALGIKRLLPTLQQSFSSLAKIQGSRIALRRVLAALERPTDQLLGMVVTEPLELRRNLQLDRVWFRYGEETGWVIQDLSLEIAAKTTVALVGSTGSGKSTTADLILGLLQPERGQILVDGLPLNGERLQRWQQTIAHVPQQIFLCDGTLAENIAFGIPEKQIDFDQVRKAARLAQIEDFIEGLPAAYETCVGERGIRLSGGQRQRIGIARALYKNASVIVFDEATSALDNVTEREVMAAIDGLSGELTIILIAHRLSTIERCNFVVELRQGKVIAQGSYLEVLKKSDGLHRMSIHGDDLSI